MLEIENLTISYDHAPVLWDLSFTLPKGIICAIAGPNGAGKSTLLKAAVGLVQPQAGQIFWMGTPIAKMRQRIAYIPQRESIDWDFPITAFDVVLMGRYDRFGFFARPRRSDRDAAMLALEQLGMSEMADCQIGQLSGGQQQRLFIARALVQEPDLFLLDEPFSNVDLTTEKTIMDLFQRLRADGKTILIVFHDLLNAQNSFDYLVLLNRRLIAAGPWEKTFQPVILAQAFGKGQSLFEEAASRSIRARQGMTP